MKSCWKLLIFHFSQLKQLHLLILESFDGKVIPTFDILEEFVVDEDGSSNYCLYLGKKAGDNGLTALPVADLSTVLDVSSTVGTDPASQTPVKIEPKYY